MTRAISSTPFIAMLLCAVACQRVTPQARSDWRVGPQTFGSIRFGMQLSEAATALRDTFSMGEDLRGCTYASSRALPPGVLLMVVGGTVVRVDVAQPGVFTETGVGVGSTEDEVKRAYSGVVRTEPHPYSGPAWHYLTYVNAGDTGYAIIFETDGQRVQTYRAGRQPEVGYIEGCA